MWQKGGEHVAKRGGACGKAIYGKLILKGFDKIFFS